MNTILARNLSSRGCNEASLNNYFSAIGPVSKIILDTAAKSARIAFRTPSDAQKALSHNGKWFIGAALQLSLAPQLKRSRSRSLSRSPSPSPKRRRSRSISRSPSRRTYRAPSRGSPSRSISRSPCRSPDTRRWDRRSHSRSCSISPNRNHRSRSVSPIRRGASCCLTDLLEGTTEEIIRSAVVDSLNNTTEPFSHNDIQDILLDNDNHMALISFRDPRFATKLRQQGNLMLFSRLIPIQDTSIWKGETSHSPSSINRKHVACFTTLDRKALEALIDPATIQYVTDVLKCSIDQEIQIEIILKGQNEKAVADAQQALRNSFAQRFTY